MKKTFILSPHLNKRLISTLMASKNNDSSESGSFSLKSTSEFAARSGDVFGKLQVLEKKHETWISENETVESYEEPNTVEVHEDSESFKRPFPARQWKRKCLESQNDDKSEQTPNFKKPFPVKHKSSVPQFKLQPQKWKKYSLENIPLSSDATNTAVALQFLDEMRQHKGKLNSNITEGSDKIVFNKPFQKKKQKTAPDSTSDSSPLDSFKSAVTASEVDSTCSENKSKSLSVTLTHLEEDECE